METVIEGNPRDIRFTDRGLVGFEISIYPMNTNVYVYSVVSLLSIQHRGWNSCSEGFATLLIDELLTSDVIEMGTTCYNSKTDERY